MSGRNKVARRKGKGGGGDEVSSYQISSEVSKVYFDCVVFLNRRRSRWRSFRKLLSTGWRRTCLWRKLNLHTLTSSNTSLPGGLLTPSWRFLVSKPLQLLVTLQDSPWSMEKSKEGAELRLEYREQAIDLMQELMRHKMFHRWSLSCRRPWTKMVFLERRKFLWPIVKRRKMTQTER